MSGSATFPSSDSLAAVITCPCLSPLPPELYCHEAGEAIQLRTLGPRTGCLLSPAQLSVSRCPGLTVLPGWADRQRDWHVLQVLATSSPAVTPLSSFLSPPSQPFWGSAHVYFSIKQFEPQSGVGVCISVVPEWGDCAGDVWVGACVGCVPSVPRSQWDCVSFGRTGRGGGGFEA